MEKYKFKIGQKVRYIGNHPGYCNVEEGDIVTISDRKKYERECSYGFKEDTDDKGKAHWLHVHKNFEVVTQKFQIGDKVKCIKESGYNFDKGEIGTISTIEIDKDNRICYGFGDEDKADWLDVEDNFELATKAVKKESVKKKAEPSKPKPKPVDQYQVLADIFMG